MTVQVKHHHRGVREVQESIQTRQGVASYKSAEATRLDGRDRSSPTAGRYAMTAASTSTSTPTDIRCFMQRRALLPLA